MNGLRERVAQVVNWKEQLSRVDLETILRVGDYCNALCERYGWKTRHAAAEWMLLEAEMQKARRAEAIN